MRLPLGVRPPFFVVKKIQKTTTKLPARQQFCGRPKFQISIKERKRGVLPVLSLKRQYIRHVFHKRRNASTLLLGCGCPPFHNRRSKKRPFKFSSLFFRRKTKDLFFVLRQQRKTNKTLPVGDNRYDECKLDAQNEAVLPPKYR